MDSRDDNYTSAQQLDKVFAAIRVQEVDFIEIPQRNNKHSLVLFSFRKKDDRDTSRSKRPAA